MEALGIEPKLLLAQVVNFLIIVIALNVLLYKPILSMLEKRKKEISEGLRFTEKMRVENEKTQGKVSALIAQSREEGQRIIEEARKDAKSEEKRILEEGRIAADGIIEKGKKTVSEEREAMQKNLRKESVQLGILIAKRLLSESMSSDIQHKILNKHIKQIEKV